MHFIEIDYKQRETEWSMSDLQSHNYYELYFLLEGSRRFFLNDKIFHITSPTVCIIPPFCMHKTEGGAYRRININVSCEALNEYEQKYLSKLGKEVVFTLDTDKAKLFLELLETAATKQLDSPKEQLTSSFLHVLLHLLSTDCLKPFNSQPETDIKKEYSISMKVATYILAHYQKEISIKQLCDEFFISKNTLSSQFKKLMNCSIMEYRQFIRISKAKELLASTNKGMREIAEECGFSSENYFSLIFKRQVGLSPTNYRKAK